MYDRITEEVVDFAVSTRFEDLPETVAQKTKQIIFDSTGCALGGYITDRGRIAIELAKCLGGKPQASIIGSEKTSYALAAQVNGDLMNALDYDLGGHYLGHLPALVIPPSLASGERSRASGKDLITAVAIGMEIGRRMRDTSVTTGAAMRETELENFSPIVLGMISATSMTRKVNTPVNTPIHVLSKCWPASWPMNMEPAMLKALLRMTSAATGRAMLCFIASNSEAPRRF